MNSKRMRILWWLTGLMALILLLATVALFVRADHIEESGILAYVTRSQAAPFLREQPGNDGAVLMVLEYGSAVRISDSETRSNQDWYYVETGEASGWLLASLISFEPPESDE
jgi:hypothetical protein